MAFGTFIPSLRLWLKHIFLSLVWGLRGEWGQTAGHRGLSLPATSSSSGWAVTQGKYEWLSRNMGANVWSEEQQTIHNRNTYAESGSGRKEAQADIKLNSEIQRTGRGVRYGQGRWVVPQLSRSSVGSEPAALLDNLCSILWWAAWPYQTGTKLNDASFSHTRICSCCFPLGWFPQGLRLSLSLISSTQHHFWFMILSSLVN